MTLRTLPDMEAVLGQALREHPDLMALGARVAGVTPDSMSRPWIRLTLLSADDDPLSGLEHLVEYTLQLDCYAGKTAQDAFSGQAEAHAVKAAARAILKNLQGQTVDGAVITRVRFASDSRLPDTAFEPVRHRYVLTAEVMAHAVQG